MSKINSYEELKEFCLAIKKCKYQKYVSFIYSDKHNEYYILWSQLKPKFDGKSWNATDFGNQSQTGNSIELTFDCDFSKCCWEVEE